MTLTNYKVNTPNKTFKKWIVAFEKSRVGLHCSRFWLKDNWLRELFTILFRWNLNVCCVIVHLFSELCTLVLHVLKPNISPCYISLYHYNIMWRYLQCCNCGINANVSNEFHGNLRRAREDKKKAMLCPGCSCSSCSYF